MFQPAADGSFIARHASVVHLSKPRVTHDAIIWPAARRDMKDAKDCIRRMSYDLAVMLKQRGADAVIMLDDYLRLGWTRDQITAYAVEAHGMLPEIQKSGVPLEAA